MSLFWCRSLRRIPLLALGASLVAAPVWGATFESTMADAAWQLESSQFECRLSQAIPLYGAAVFSRRAGEEQSFYLRQDSRQLAPGEARLEVQNPLWEEIPGSRELGRVDVVEGERPVQLDWRDSQQLMATLQSGKRLVFARQAWYGEDTQVRIMVEPVSFRPALERFHRCQAGLLPVNYDQIARTALYFQLGQDELPDEELEKLEQLALYARADDAVTRIFIDGHTDAMGLRADNLELSRQRAEWVAQYLMDRDVPESMITVRWHGERYPVASNHTPEGRHQNRRVTLRVDRADERLNASRQP
ncbi:OmpA family protein [Marinimicrobium sp. ABcell2]|uniref:flagellar protein MotY n=1 Tax=Marinimicrobium sp. ABcell2 TaxID=3069751 RepID=UPI0027B1367D|nr:OmpA family protein [Marinimicrobium sp. ABcell2]MDQ2075382.1 OmpA family protein [Marinimicrobium sp. ABcell2]